MVLTGKFEYTMDSKKRLFIPAKHREILGESFMITCGTDNCLAVYSMEEWENFTKKIDELPTTQARQLVRFIYSTATVAQPDAQGRVVLSEDQIKYAQIDKDAVVIGCGRRDEIWSREKWENQSCNTDPDSMTALMESLGL